MNVVTGFCSDYREEIIELSDLIGFDEDVLLEFGTPWCGYCKRSQKLIEHVLDDFSDVVHIKVLDGKGKRLGRHFQVKLWPTLIVLRKGEEVARIVRPETEDELRRLLES